MAQEINYIITDYEREQAERMSKKWKARAEAFFDVNAGWGREIFGYCKTPEDAKKAIENAEKIDRAIEKAIYGNGTWKDLEIISSAIADRAELDAQIAIDRNLDRESSIKMTPEQEGIIPSGYQTTVGSTTDGTSVVVAVSQDIDIYANKSSGSYHPGQIVYSTVMLPGAFSEQSKLFAVKGVDPETGSIAAYLLTSKINKNTQSAAVNVIPDDTNKLRYPTLVQTDREFSFPADWKFRTMKGSLSDKDFQRATEIQKRYIDSGHYIETVQVTQSMEDELKILQNQMQSAVDNFKADPNQLLEYLEFSEKFYHYSSRNRTLMYMQNPHATFVASESYWQRTLGHDVRPEELGAGVTIVRRQVSEAFNREGQGWTKVSDATPEEKQKIVNKEIEVRQSATYLPAMVYDISQTTCPKENYPSIFNMGRPSDDHRQALDAMIELAQKNEFTVKEEMLPSISLRGLCIPEKNEITLNTHFQDTQRLSTMCHEYAHGIMHKTSTQSKHGCEFEAEAFGWMLAKHMGVDPEPNRAGKIQYHLEEAQKDPAFNMEGSLKRIHNAFGHVAKGLESLMNSRGQEIDPSDHSQEKRRGRGVTMLEANGRETRTMSPGGESEIAANFTTGM